jgi:hypothetical protein
MAQLSHPDVNPAREASLSSYESTPVLRTEHGESTLTRMVEHQTARIPSDVFLFASLCAMGVALGAEVTDRRRLSRFVGMWVAPLLVMGVYNKLVKTFGPS